MGMQVEFNWFIVAKSRNDVSPGLRGKGQGVSLNLSLTKAGQRIYPVGKTFTLPVIVEGKCLGLAFIKKQEMTERMTTIWFEIVTAFDENDPIAKYYEESFAAYKEKQEELDTGGKIDLASKFLTRLHGGDIR